MPDNTIDLAIEIYGGVTTCDLDTQDVDNMLMLFESEVASNARNAAIEECAKFLDNDAARMKKRWDDYMAGNPSGPATSFQTIPIKYAEELRKLKK